MSSVALQNASISCLNPLNVKDVFVHRCSFSFVSTSIYTALVSFRLLCFHPIDVGRVCLQLIKIFLLAYPYGRPVCILWGICTP